MEKINLLKKRTSLFDFHDLLRNIELKNLKIPEAFIRLYSQYRLEALSAIVYHCGFTINIKDINGRLRAINFAKPKWIHLHELDYGEGNIEWFPLISFAEESSNDGGVFISLQDVEFGSIYSYIVDPDRSTDEDRTLIAYNIDDLINSIILIDNSTEQQVSFSNELLANSWLNDQLGIDPYWYPWETPGFVFEFPWEED